MIHSSKLQFCHISHDWFLFQIFFHFFLMQLNLKRMASETLLIMASPITVLFLHAQNFLSVILFLVESIGQSQHLQWCLIPVFHSAKQFTFFKQFHCTRLLNH